MKWLERSGTWFSAPYRVTRDTRGGYTAWIYSTQRSGRLGGTHATAVLAKEFCEADKRKSLYNRQENPTQSAT